MKNQKERKGYRNACVGERRRTITRKGYGQEPLTEVIGIKNKKPLTHPTNKTHRLDFCARGRGRVGLFGIIQQILKEKTV